MIRKVGCALFLLSAWTGDASSQGYHYESGYQRQDGSYVQPHYQTNPDGDRSNNWSTQGNTNPFTGRQGTVSPYEHDGSSDAYRTQPSSQPWGSTQMNPSSDLQPYQR